MELREALESVGPSAGGRLIDASLLASGDFADRNAALEFSDHEVETGQLALASFPFNFRIVFRNGFGIMRQRIWIRTNSINYSKLI
jgi:hypothetical protein